MSTYQVLYRAWRPAVFGDMVGQDPIVRTLRRQIVSGHIAHAYLFCGSRGTGKTTASKILARAINCLHPVDGDPCGECESCRAILSDNCMDVLEIDAASNNGVDEIRDLRERIQFPPTMTRYKVYIIDEVHMLSTGAFNALLKTLEEPPEHAVFILATTEPQKLLPTILSRCQRFDFHRISVAAIVERLHTVLSGIGREAEEDALVEIARAAEGGMRDALSLLDCCLSYTDRAVTAELARDVLGTAGRALMFEFADALIDFDAARALMLIDSMMNSGCDPIVFSRDAAAHLRGLMLAKSIGDVSKLLDLTEEDARHLSEQAERVQSDRLIRLTDLFVRVEGDSRWISNQRTMVELAAVRACHPEQEPEAGMAERLEKVEKQLENGVTVRKAPARPAASAAQTQPAVKRTGDSAQQTPHDAPPEEFLTGLEAFFAATPSVKPAQGFVQFVRLEGDVVWLEMPKNKVMVQKLLERKLDDLGACLTESFGRTIRADFVKSGPAGAAASGSGKLTAQSRPIVEKALDVFGRDKISFTD